MVVIVITSRYDTLWEDYYSSYKGVASPHRKPGLFKWLYESYIFLHLSCVDSSSIYKLADFKACLALVDTAIDDCCDNASFIKKNGGDKFSYDMLSILYNVDKITYGTYDSSQLNLDNLYTKITFDIFSDFLKNHLISLPRYYDFKSEFFLSIRKVAESMEFSYLLNKSKIAYPYSLVVQNKGPSTMVAVLSIVDLMSSKSFDASELGKAIALFDMADIVAMLNNAVNTWKKEIVERDYSSPVISLALEKKLIKLSDFDNLSTEIIEEKLLPVSQMVNEDLNRRLILMEEFAEIYKIKSFDASKYINNYRTYAFKSQKKNREISQRQTA
jgi:hypothetical protein